MRRESGEGEGGGGRNTSLSISDSVVLCRLYNYFEFKLATKPFYVSRCVCV